jgi:hypothetical protein
LKDVFIAISPELQKEDEKFGCALVAEENEKADEEGEPKI